MGNNGEPPPGVPAPGGRVVVIRPAAVLGGTILAAALLTAAHLGLTRFRPPPGTWTVVSVLRPLFDLDQEGTIPVWYSGTLLFLAGAAAFARGSYLRRADRRSHWRVYLAMAAGFTALSVDEVAQVHERVNAAAAAAAGRQGYPLLGGRSEGLTAVAVYAAAA
ncbi:MAG: hypothetical protein K2X82_06350, partial [Gemmataceae bacterium]|nr:hypothetical protein [Gemmataceae bacterium]